jgi:rsbT co-antagonist protein RsbR
MNITTSMMRLSFQRRLVLAFGSLALLVAAMAAATLWGLNTLRTSASFTTADIQTSRLANDVALQALLCRRYEKDFFLSSGSLEAQDAPLQLWHQASMDLRGSIKAFEDAATTDADRQRGRAWREAWSLYTRDFGRIEIAINDGAIKTPQDALNKFEPFQANIQTLTDQAVQLASEKSVSAQQASASLDQVGTSTTWLVMLIAALVFAASVASSLLFPARLVRPLKVLREAASRLAEGDLTARVALQRSDELGMLSQSFDHMAATIQQRTAEIEAQYDRADAARTVAEVAHSKIAEQLATIEEQRTVISEMSVPILPLSDSTLVLPLVGALDSGRMHQAQERALKAIEDTSAHFLLLDITGVPVVDTLVALGLLQIVHTGSLLGCTVVLVGIRPEVAQAIVGIGLDLRRVVTRSTLQSGIAYTLRQSV